MRTKRNQAGINTMKFEMLSVNKKLLAALPLVLTSFVTSQVQAQPVQLLSVTFNKGYIGQVDNNTQDIKNIQRTSTCGITSVSFDQLDTDGDGLFDIPETATKDQGNDFPGQLTFSYVDGVGAEQEQTVQLPAHYA
jgi:hypothetical protein